MNKRGFTLIEILAVVMLISLIFILVIPKITNSLKKKKSDIDITTTNLVLSAAKLYVQDNSSKFEKTDGNVSCIPLNILVRKGYLESSVKNVTDDIYITNTKSIKITYNDKFIYELVDKKECEIAYIPQCDADYCDLSGNEYTEVEYLKSTGTQYIDTKYVPNENTSIKIEFEPQEITGAGFLGIVESDQVKTYRLFNYSSKIFFDLNGRLYGDSSPVNERVNIELYNYYVIKNGVKVLNGNYKDNLSLSNSMYIFGTRFVSSNTISYSKMKLYRLEIYENNNLIRDYVPVLDPSNRPCLYDTLSKQCYYNQGTGEFLYG